MTYVATTSLVRLNQTTRRYKAEETKVAFARKAEGRDSLRVADFTRQELDQLGLGQDLTEVYRGRKHYPISNAPGSGRTLAR